MKVADHLSPALDGGGGLKHKAAPPAVRAALLGHADVSTTMIYTHVLNKGGKGVKSPLDV